MRQDELYSLAAKLTDKEVAYLVCSHLEYINKAEMGWKLKCDNRVFEGKVECKPANERRYVKIEA